MSLKQARAGIAAAIKANPSRVTISRKPMVSDDVGGMVVNPFGIATAYTIKCRIAHEQSSVQRDEQNPAGLSTNLSRFILVDHKTTIQAGDAFTLDNVGGFEIGVVDPLIKFGGIIGYQAPLKET